MSPFRKLLLVVVGVFALHGVQACTSETELNPQPLPPQNPEGDQEGVPAGSAKGSGDPNDGTSTGGTSGTPAPSPDAGAEGGDASDAGDG